MGTSKLFTIVLFLSFVFVYCSCKKSDIKIAETHDLENKFLMVSPNASSAIKRIAETIRKQNEKFHFLNEFVKKQGFARWDKSPVIPKPVGYGARSQISGGDTIVIVPLVRIDSARVTAFLACRVTDDSVQIKLYRADRFASYPISNSTDSLTSTFIAYQTMTLDYLTFGYNLFELKDQRIFNSSANVSSEKSTRLLRLKPQQNSSARNAGLVYATTCTWVFVYPYGFQTGGTAPGEQNDYGHEEFRCTSYYVYVQTFYPDVSGGDPIPPIEGGSGGGSVGYTNSAGTYFWNTNSCGDPNSPSVPVDSDCMNGVIGWQPIPLTVDWFNGLPPYLIDVTGLASYPCAQNIAQSVIQLNNSTIQIIKDIFSESVKYNIYFDTNIGDPNADGTTSPDPQWMPIPGENGPLTQLDITIHLNPSLLNQATKLYIAETIIHEMIHAYFNYRSIDAYGDAVKTQKLNGELGFFKTLGS